MADQEIQISFVLKGRDVAAFLNYKDSQFLQANAEVARQLILQRLSQIQHDAQHADARALSRRKPGVRASLPAASRGERKENVA
jgi:hypothetical protein